MSRLVGLQPAELNRGDEDGVTALHQAARYSQLEVVQVLLPRWADVDCRESEGMTPLHFAAR